MLSTAMILARRCLNERLGKEAATWAVTQLELGFDGKYLRQLAGILGDENPFELDELFDQCVREQNLQRPKPESLVILYAQERCLQFQQGMISRAYLLSRLFELCAKHDMRRELMPFYLLDCASDDLQRQELSYYYRGVTRHNFDRVLQDEIRKLMAVPIEYEPRMDMNGPE
jgi:hypothetical protein